MQPVYVKIQNFKSIGNIELDLKKYKDKAVLIQAENKDDTGAKSNRSGKSNFTKAFVWCLFGVGSIDGTTDEVVRYGEKEASVIIRFDNGIEVERRFKNKAQTFFYRVNGVDKADSNKDAEGLFLQDIGLKEKNKAIISNGIYLNAEADNLISSTPKDRLDIFTNWFNLNRYDTAVQLTRDKLKEWAAELVSIDTQLEQIKSAKPEIEILEKGILEIEQSIRDLSSKKAKLEDKQKVFDNYEALKNQGFAIINQIKSLDEQNEKIDKAQDELKEIDIKQLEKDEKELDQAVLDYQEAKRELQKEINTLESQIVSPLVCPVCSSHLIKDDSGLHQVSVEKNDEFKKLIETKKLKLGSMVKPDDSKSYFYEKEIKRYYSLETLAKQEKKDTTELRGKVEELRAKLQDKPEDYSSEIRELSSKLMNLSSDKGRIESNLSFSKGLISKESGLLSKSEELTENCRLAKLWAGERNKTGIYQEIKSLLFSKIISNLQCIANNILNNHFGITSQVKIESTTKGIEIYQFIDGEEHPVSSMSGGEKARVAFALALALKNLYSTKLDLLICDETFGALDETGMQFVIKTLNTFEGMKFLISHVQVDAEHQIDLIKENGVTRYGK